MEKIKIILSEFHNGYFGANEAAYKIILELSDESTILETYSKLPNTIKTRIEKNITKIPDPKNLIFIFGGYRVEKEEDRNIRLLQEEEMKIKYVDNLKVWKKVLEGKTG